MEYKKAGIAQTAKADTYTDEGQKWLERAVGDYIIKSYVGSGTFGHVFKAVHSRSGFSVAVKIAHPFKQEFQDNLLSLMQSTAQKIDLPGIVGPIDFGTVEFENERRFYLVTEFVEDAENIRPAAPVNSGKEYYDRLDIFIKVLESIEKLHNYKHFNALGEEQKGIIHGDLRPHHILINPDGEHKIIDLHTNFRRIKTLQETHDSDALNDLSCSNIFIAKEVFEKGVLTEQSDVYALGITLFEVLFARLPEIEKLNGSLKDFQNYAAQLNKYVSKDTLTAIWRASRERPEERFLDVTQFIGALKPGTRGNKIKKLRYAIAGATFFFFLAAIVWVSIDLLNKSVTGDNDADDTGSRGLFLKGGGSRNNTEYNIITSKYFALIIGEDAYPDTNGLAYLSKPVTDAKSFYNTLKTSYKFDSILLLKNATRSEIYSAFESLHRLIKDSDNFLVFFAGHGYWDSLAKQGYWIPVDGSATKRDKWISNSDIKDHFNSIGALHTLLISDACFSGSILLLRGVQQPKSEPVLYQIRSCKAMTSGALTEVPDESIFIESMLSALQKNRKTYLKEDDLFFSFRDRATTNRDLVPLHSAIRGTHDEGGEFIFRHR